MSIKEIEFKVKNHPLKITPPEMATEANNLMKHLRN